jgi:AraC-like DNA-binding protein
MKITRILPINFERIASMLKKIELHDVLKELHNISGFRISIYDTQLHEVAAYPKELTSFCKLVQRDPRGHKICVQNDADAFAIAKSKGDVHIYQCHFGLYEAVAPIYHFGVLTGYLMMGQSLDTLADSRAHLFEQASVYVKEKDLLENEIKQICISSKDKILSCVSIMNICADYISLSNRLNLSDKNLAEAVKKHINQNYHTKITLDMLCSLFFYSKPTIMNAFKKTFGNTISEYLLETRLTHANKLLSGTTSTIHQVSQQCGFSDQNYFTKVFTKEFGVTPSQYRIDIQNTPTEIHTL